MCWQSYRRGSLSTWARRELLRVAAECTWSTDTIVLQKAANVDFSG